MISREVGIEMTNIMIDTSILNTVGFGGIAGFSIWFMLKKVE
jgi:uncharacterized membrane protein (Fun14 family)